MSENKGLFDLSHARVSSQKARMEECARLGICPFCWENLDGWHDAPVLKQGNFWIITANDHPYPGSKHHFLAIYRDHISHIYELALGAGDELLSLFSELCIEIGIEGATILMRFGEMVYTGATVSHLHAHIISGASKEDASEIKYPKSFITTVLGYKTEK